jgi:hypothetical protein
MIREKSNFDEHFSSIGKCCGFIDRIMGLSVFEVFSTIVQAQQ